MQNKKFEFYRARRRSLVADDAALFTHELMQLAYAVDFLRFLGMFGFSKSVLGTHVCVLLFLLLFIGLFAKQGILAEGLTEKLG